MTHTMILSINDFTPHNAFKVKKMYKPFPESSEPHELAELQLLEVGNGNNHNISLHDFFSLLTTTYLENGAASHNFTIFLDPENKSPGSEQMIFIRISIDDNFS